MTPDIEKVSALIRAVAAEEILPRFQKLAAHDVREKRPGNVVTTADLAAEVRLIDGLGALAPGSTVVAEEMAEADLAGTLGRLSEAVPVWIIDPVDGTANFAAGRPEFAVIVAYVELGRTRAGWILDVVNDTMAVAEEGSGAFEGDARLRAAAAAPLSEMTGYLGARLRRHAALIDRLGPIRVTRCAGRDHRDLAVGVLHYALFRRSLPWDHAAGSLLHREAGGYNAAYDGAPYDPAGAPEQGILLAPDRDTWHELHALTAPAFQGS